MDALFENYNIQGTIPITASVPLLTSGRASFSRAISRTYFRLPPERRPCLRIVGALSEHGLPESVHFGLIPALGGERGQVAPGEVAVDSLVDAAKLIGTLERQNQPPAFLGLGRFAPMPVHHPPAEPQLGIFRVELEPLRARGQCKRESPIIWCARASRAKIFLTIESLGAEPARLRLR